MRNNHVLPSIIEFLMEGGVFKIEDTYVVFSDDLLLCELTNVVEDENGIANHGDLIPSDITFNQFVISCMNLTKESLESIQFSMAEPISEC